MIVIIMIEVLFTARDTALTKSGVKYVRLNFRTKHKEIRF